MPSLDFPTSPTNGQTYTLNGVTYYYNATVGGWLTQLTSMSISAASNNQVLFNDGGIANGSPGLVFNKSANTLAANVIAATSISTTSLDVFNITGSALSTTNNNIVAAFNRANNSLQNTSFTLNGDLTVSGAVNTSILVNTTILRSNTIQAFGGRSYLIDGYPRMPGQIIEYLASPCDGSTISGASGSYTVENVTAQQSVPTSYVDVTGSSITYTPPAGATRIIYRFTWSGYWVNAHGINHYKFFIGGNEILYARHCRSAQYSEDKYTFEWPIAIGGVTNYNVGRLATWTTGLLMKMQVYGYGSNSKNLHGTTYWDGGSSNQFSIPHISIIAIA